MAKKKTERKQLTEKERRFVELYMGECAGNGTESARRSGYTGSDEALASRASHLLRKDKVREAIGERVEKDSRVATRKERQEFWTKAMNGTVGKLRIGMQHRLKASELLGRSQRDFVHENGLNPDGSAIPQKLVIELVEVKSGGAR